MEGCLLDCAISLFGVDGCLLTRGSGRCFDVDDHLLRGMNHTNLCNTCTKRLVFWHIRRCSTSVSGWGEMGDKIKNKNRGGLV
jgi:hypothetical protein